MLRYEQAAWQQGYDKVAGVDEAGRGPLAGPVVAAAVVFDRGFLSREINGQLQEVQDSKQLTASRRTRLYDVITATAAAWAIGMADVDEIDACNILQATYRAMRRALNGLEAACDFILVDGRPVPNLPGPSRSIVKGDANSVSIAAASILAKVQRDRIMIALAREYPDFGFERHKGYGTRAHLQALQQYGPTPIHRQSFAPVRQARVP